MSLATDNKISYTFFRSGDDRRVEIGFHLHRDMPWSEILPFFLDFLHANGYVIDPSHEIYEMCSYDHSIE